MSNNNYSLNLVYLYPEEMNIYGDMGNIITFKKRCEWRGIQLDISTITLDHNPEIEGDIYFMGGGQDNDMYKVFEDLRNNKYDFIKTQFDNGKTFLLICGGFQLFGKYFLDSSGREIKGLDILPIVTKAPGDKLKDRCLGNLISEIKDDFYKKIERIYPGKMSKFIVGFENHGGQTFFQSDNISPIGKVLVGKGNNIYDKIEGAICENVIASYSHGSLLPKNPHLADYIIGTALSQKYQKSIVLEELDDSIEWQAHNAMLNKMGIS